MLIAPARHRRIATSVALFLLVGKADWSSFVLQTLSTATGAAAGGAAAVAFLNPALGAVMGPAVQATTEQLLAEILPAQLQALDELLARTRGIESLLGEVRSDMQKLVEGPWKAARLHIEDALKHPTRAQDELFLARNSLYDAW